jgi:hypothetical protein
MKGEVVIRASDWRTLASRSENTSADRCGRIPAPLELVLELVVSDGQHSAPRVLSKDDLHCYEVFACA